MLKRFAILFTFVFAILCFAPNIFAQNEGLQLNKTTIIIPCPPGGTMRTECEDDSSIKVKTAVPAKAKNLKYQYSVSGGRIIGNGKRVEWDLLGARPGAYTITATVEGRNNFRKVFSRQITVANCTMCISDCFCPHLNVSGRSEDSSSRIIYFAANVTGGSQTKLKYKWQISDGKIIEGQGTPFIKVAIKNLKTKSVTASVEIDGDLCVDCVRTAKITVIVD